MKCPMCHALDTKVVDSRSVASGRMIRRRRECEGCGYRFSTTERVAITDLIVRKRNGEKELYNRDKLKNALMMAFGKKHFSMETIENILMLLESKRAGKGKEITSQQIGEDVLVTLKDINEFAYVRFASVFMEFDTKDDFRKMLE